MCISSQLVVNPILIYCHILDSAEYHKNGMSYINAIIRAYRFPTAHLHKIPCPALEWIRHRTHLLKNQRTPHGVR